MFHGMPGGTIASLPLDPSIISQAQLVPHGNVVHGHIEGPPRGSGRGGNRGGPPRGSAWWRGHVSENCGSRRQTFPFEPLMASVVTVFPFICGDLLIMEHGQTRHRKQGCDSLAVAMEATIQIRFHGREGPLLA